jgi:hypothetical protein
LAQFFDISNWIHKEWSSPPKGSRPVKIFAHPETDGDYFFKQSAANYPSEFWSEVIASKIGRVAGLETLEYNVALHRGVLGCLSKSMVGPEPMMLIHGVDILSDHASGFEINHKPVHSFQQIMEVCAKEEFRNFKKRFLEMIVFDALIGNTDRHTENWGIILKLVFEFQEPKAPMKLRVKGGLRSAIKALIGMPVALEFDGTLPMTVRKEFIFSPVFDSGSCLGREINEASISSYLIDDNRINSYLNRSRQEIRWNELRMNTFCKLPLFRGLLS